MKKSALGLVVLLTLILSVGTALAHRSGGGMMGGYGAGDGDGYCNRYANADPAEVRAITDKYASQFDALRKKMDTKRDAIQKARANDETTVGQLKVLRDEMLAVKKEYRALRGTVEDEMVQKFGEPEDDERMGMMGGRHHRGEMMGDFGGCR